MPCLMRNECIPASRTNPLGLRLMRSIGFCLTAVVVAWSSLAHGDKEPYCSWDSEITEDRLMASDQYLYSSNDPRIDAAIAEHLPWGLPAGINPDDPSEFLLVQPHFVIFYDSDLRVPLWTAHHLNQYEAQVTRNGTGSEDWEARADSFRSDPRLQPDQKSTCRDYKEPIFDQGHLVPNADLDFITAGAPHSIGMDHSFLMSNMTPQHCAFNRGPWWVLESLVQEWATSADDTWIIAGTLFDRDEDDLRDPDIDAWLMEGKDGDRRVAIPSSQYKIIAQWTGQEWSTISFIIPNSDELVPNNQMPDFMQDHVVSLDQIADASGFDFLGNHAVVEATLMWPVFGSWPSVLTSRCQNTYPDF